MKRPRIVAVDGPSGCGKSTIVPLVAKLLVERGVPATTASNNEDSPFATAIRTLADAATTPLALSLAVAAARAYLYETRTGVLVCDRYILSTFVYQGFSGVSADYLYAINRPYLDSTILVLLRLTEAELEQRRARRQRGAIDHYKRHLAAAEEISLFEKATAELGSRGHQVAVVPAQGTPEEVAARVLERCDPARL